MWKNAQFNQGKVLINIILFIFLKYWGVPIGFNSTELLCSCVWVDSEAEAHQIWNANNAFAFHVVPLTGNRNGFIRRIENNAIYISLTATHKS